MWGIVDLRDAEPRRSQRMTGPFETKGVAMQACAQLIAYVWRNTNRRKWRVSDDGKTSWTLSDQMFDIRPYQERPSDGSILLINGQEGLDAYCRS